jgi:hypothetical protein
MWGERALDAWSALERDAIRRSRSRIRILDGPDGDRAPLWPITHVLWAGADIAANGGHPPALGRAIHPYRSGDAYAATPHGRRFYDDNAWLGLASLALAEVDDDEAARSRALELGRFVRSGEHPDGGVRWAEGSDSRNACSTASAAWLLLAAAAPDAAGTASGWLDWLDATLRDDDGLYADRIERGEIDRRLWTYNQGAALVARRLAGRSTRRLRDAVLARWGADELWREPPAFAAIAYRALLDGRDAVDVVDAVWDAYLDRLVEEARDPVTGWYTGGGVGSYDGHPTIDQAAVVEMLAIRSRI